MEYATTMVTRATTEKTRTTLDVFIHFWYSVQEISFCLELRWIIWHILMVPSRIRKAKMYPMYVSADAASKKPEKLVKKKIFSFLQMLFCTCGSLTWKCVISLTGFCAPENTLDLYLPELSHWWLHPVQPNLKEWWPFLKGYTFSWSTSISAASATRPVKAIILYYSQW